MVVSCLNAVPQLHLAKYTQLKRAVTYGCFSCDPFNNGVSFTLVRLIMNNYLKTIIKH
jgi:hypothetical protein